MRSSEGAAQNVPGPRSAEDMPEERGQLGGRGGVLQVGAELAGDPAASGQFGEMLRRDGVRREGPGESGEGEGGVRWAGKWLV